MSRMMAVVLLLVSVRGVAQDTLPRFTATTKGNDKVIISWTNNFAVISQISIQRSADSSKNFRTILTVPDPTVAQNGFVDTKAPSPSMYYRLFIVLENGNYLFSKAQRPFWDSAGAVRNTGPAQSLTGENNNRRVVIADNMPLKDVEKLKEKIKEVVKKEDPAPAPKKEPEKFFTVKKRDSILLQLPEKAFKKFRDSIVTRTKDTMAFKSMDTIVIRPFVPKEIYRPSRYVFTDKDGNVVISLPEVKQKHYAVKFFEDDQSVLFDIRQVKEPLLTIDKVNFLHAGWFRFELYEDGKLKETHKFLIPKDF